MSDKEKLNIEFLGDMYKITKNNIASFERLIHISDDLALGSILMDFVEEIKNISSEIENQLATFGKKPKAMGDIERTASNFANNIQTGLQTLFDKSTSRIAELVMESMLDYIVIGYRELHKNSFEHATMDINKKLLKLHEKIFDSMKKIL